MEKFEIGRSELISVLFFVASVIFWVATLMELGQHPEWKDSVLAGPEDYFPHVWYTVCALWSVSLYFKLWLFAAAASTVVCWQIGGPLSLFAAPCVTLLPRFIPAADEVMFGCEQFMGISSEVWTFVIGINCVIVIIAMIKYRLQRE